MTAAAAGAKLRATAAQVVDAVASGGRSLDTVLAEFEPQVAPEDRSLLRLLSYGSLRHHWRLQSWIDAMLKQPLQGPDRVVNALLAVGLYQLFETRIPDHAAVAATVEAARLLRRPRLKPLVNAVLRRALRDRLSAQPVSNVEAEYDHPQWLIDAMRADWPDDWAEILAANNRQAPMWLRVNPASGSAAAHRERLAAAGIEAELSAAAPQALRLAQPLPVDSLPGFREGTVSVQDAAAQLAAPWLLAGTAGRMLDACAAPGGKSGHLLELGGGQIDLTCIDNDELRLAGVTATLDRLGFDATLLAADASKPGEWWDGKPYDGILLDAPCSASGVIRRHPDIKLLRRAADIDSLARRQTQMLGALWPLLRPGGRLLYVTCSVLAAENEAIVAAFLERQGDARENDVLHNNNIRDLMRNKACGFQILPGTAGMDGFYFACLEKVS